MDKSRKIELEINELRQELDNLNKAIGVQQIEKIQINRRYTDYIVNDYSTTDTIYIINPYKQILGAYIVVNELFLGGQNMQTKLNLGTNSSDYNNIFNQQILYTEENRLIKSYNTFYQQAYLFMEKTNLKIKLTADYKLNNLTSGNMDIYLLIL